MTSNPIDAVRTFIAAINRRSLPEMTALMAHDHTFVDSGGRVATGLQDLASGWAEYFRMFPDYEIHIDSILADGERVAVFGSASGTYAGKRGLVPQNRIAMPAAWRARVAAGKIVEWQVYADWTEGTRIIGEDAGSG